MRLSDDEYEVVTNIWGVRTPDDVSDIETAQLVDMLIRVSRGVGRSIEDGDMESLALLEGLEGKLEGEVRARLDEAR